MVHAAAADEVRVLEHSVLSRQGRAKARAVDVLVLAQIAAWLAVYNRLDGDGVCARDLGLADRCPIRGRALDSEIALIRPEVHPALEDADSGKLPAVDQRPAEGASLEQIRRQPAVGDVQHVGPVIADNAVIAVPGVDIVPSRARVAGTPEAQVLAERVGGRVSQTAGLASQQYLQGVVVL